MSTLRQIMNDAGIDPSQVLFLRFDTEMPAGRGAALVHWRVGIDGSDVFEMLDTARASALLHTFIPVDELKANEMDRQSVYTELKAVIEAAPLVVTYQWRRKRGFEQYQCLASLFNFEKDCPPFEPWPIVDIFDIEKLWLGGKRIDYENMDMAFTNLSTAASGGPFTGSLSDVMGRVWCSHYDLKGARQMMFALVEIFKRQMDEADIFDRVPGDVSLMRT